MKPLKLLFILFLAISPGLHSQTAPVTMAGVITDATPGDTSVPVAITVTDFTDIGHFTLTLKFDTTRVTFISAVLNPLLAGMTATFTPPAGNTQGMLVLAWTGGQNQSLDDGADLAGLTFHYKTGTGLLKWSYSFGTICIYKRYDGSTLINLNDTPKSQYYLNGGIANRGAPVISAPELSDPLPGALPVILITNDFTQITGFTLYLEYDPAIMTYISFIKNSVFDNNFLVSDNQGSAGKRLIIIQWYGSAVSISNGDSLCTLNFSYPAPVCDQGPLHWYGNGPTCQYSDLAGDVLIDMPQSSYYLDGTIEAGLPSVWTGIISNEWNDPGNWNDCGVPDSSRDVIIPDVVNDNFPVITGFTSCQSIEILQGAVFILAPTGHLTIGE